MLDQLLRERLSKNEYRVYNAFLILSGLWLLYGMIDESGLPGLLMRFQANYLFGGRFYPFLTFIISFALVLFLIGGLFLLYAKFRAPKGG
jgi:hypothetical protein